MKKNFIKVPDSLLVKAKKLKEDNIVVFGIIKANKSDIITGEYLHLSLSIKDGKVQFKGNFIPNKEQGKYSDWNINGREIKRIDLPKETFYIYVEAPNWGDSYNGTHTVAFQKERYPVEFISPRLSSIKIELLTENKDDYIFRFVLSEVLNRNDKNFISRLLYCINLMQENVGMADIVESTVTAEDYIHTHTISWEILPPGEKEKFITRLFTGRQFTPEEKKTTEERYDFFMKLKPKEMIIGVNNFQRYFGAKIDENLILFENTDYGNALYIMYENWEELSKKSRIELLSGRYGRDFDRVVHSGDWKEKTKAILKNNK